MDALYTCHICNIKCHSPINYANHQKGKKHLNKLRTLSGDWPEDNAEPKQGISKQNHANLKSVDSLSKVKLNETGNKYKKRFPTHCLKCFKLIPADLYLEHKKSSEHFGNLIKSFLLRGKANYCVIVSLKMRGEITKEIKNTVICYLQGFGKVKMKIYCQKRWIVEFEDRNVAEKIPKEIHHVENFGLDIQSLSFNPNKKKKIFENDELMQLDALNAKSSADHTSGVYDASAQSLSRNQRRKFRKKQKQLISALCKEKDVWIPPIVWTLKTIDTIEGQLYSFTTTTLSNDDKQQKINVIFQDVVAAIKAMSPCYEVVIQDMGEILSKKDVNLHVMNTNDDSKVFMNKIRVALLNTQRFRFAYILFTEPNFVVKTLHKVVPIQCFIRLKPQEIPVFSYLEYLISLDTKIKPILSFLKYLCRFLWDDDNFSEYPITLLYVFVLLQEPFSLPSLASCQANVQSALTLDNWNYNFRPDSSYLNVSIKYMTVRDVLYNFFNFYASYNFQGYVICPYLGKSLKKRDFLVPEKLPKEFVAYRENLKQMKSISTNSYICLQDVFEHNRNITENVAEKNFVYFEYYCKLAVDIIEETEQDSNLLFNLLTAKSPEFFRALSEGVFEFSIKMTDEPRYLKCKTDEATLATQWSETMLTFVDHVFKDIFKINMIYSRNKKKIPSMPPNTKLFKCQTYFNLWDDRPSYDKDPSKSIIESEKSITEMMMKTYDCKLFGKFEFSLCIDEASSDCKEIIFQFINLSVEMLMFFEFISIYLEEWFRQYEQELVNGAAALLPVMVNLRDDDASRKCEIKLKMKRNIEYLRYSPGSKNLMMAWYDVVIVFVQNIFQFLLEISMKVEVKNVPHIENDKFYLCQTYYNLWETRPRRNQYTNFFFSVEESITEMLVNSESSHMGKKLEFLLSVVTQYSTDYQMEITLCFIKNNTVMRSLYDFLDKHLHQWFELYEKELLVGGRFFQQVCDILPIFQSAMDPSTSDTKICQNDIPKGDSGIVIKTTEIAPIKSNESNESKVNSINKDSESTQKDIPLKDLESTDKDNMSQIMSGEPSGDEDIPADFFDDFSNQDFMDGLDIVDAWDDEDRKKKLSQDNDRKSKRKDRKRKPRRSKDKERWKRSRSKDKSSTTGSKQIDRKYRSREKMRSRSRDRKVVRSGSKLKGNQTNPIVEDIELRRDPEKTKRDIERDKERCAKTKEQKLISEKLKVVETGLVPPGMEMEANLNDIKEQVRENKRVSKQEDTKESKKTPKPEETRVAERRKSKSRSLEYGKRYGDFRERERKDFSRHRSHSREGVRFRPRYTSRSPVRKQDPVYYKVHSRERSHEGNGVRSIARIRERRHSPFVSKRRRTRSPSLSDREMWLTEKRFARRRSRSPERKYLTGKKQEETMSFLEELKMKLNEPSILPPQPMPMPNPYTVQNPNTYIPTISATMPIPAPVPAPNTPRFYPQSNQQYDQQYDQQFFIGENQTANHSPFNPQMGHPIIPQFHRPVLEQPLLPLGQSKPISSPTISVPPLNLLGNTLNKKTPQKNMLNVQNKSTPKDDVTKLFEDKKISLSDFLSITAKPEVHSSSPAHLQKKIQVLSRCQDTLKELGGDKKFGGKLSLKSLLKKLPQTGTKTNCSPLQKQGPVRFNYSTPSRSEEKGQFHGTLNRILVKVGVLSEVVDLDLHEDESDKDIPSAPDPPKIGNQKRKPRKPVQDSLFGTKVLMKMTQTDPDTCRMCEKRNSVSQVSKGIQCDFGDPVSIGVQVTESDLNNRVISKNQSLAYLTPAQLLGKEDSMKMDKPGGVFTKARYEDDRSFRNSEYRGPYERAVAERFNEPVDHRRLAFTPSSGLLGATPPDLFHGRLGPNVPRFSSTNFNEPSFNAQFTMNRFGFRH